MDRVVIYLTCMLKCGNLHDSRLSYTLNDSQKWTCPLKTVSNVKISLLVIIPKRKQQKTNVQLNSGPVDSHSTPKLDKYKTQQEKVEKITNNKYEPHKNGWTPVTDLTG